MSSTRQISELSINAMLIRALQLSSMSDDCIESNYFWASYAKALSDILNGAGQGAAEKDGISLEDQKAIIEGGITALPDNLKRMKSVIRSQRLKAVSPEVSANSHSDSDLKAINNFKDGIQAVINFDDELISDFVDMCNRAVHRKLLVDRWLGDVNPTTGSSSGGAL